MTVTPVFFYLLPKLEVDAASQHFLNIDTGFGTDGLQHRTAFADDDALVGILFTDDGGFDVRDLAALFHAFHRNGDAVRSIITAEYYASAAGPIAPRPVHSALALDKIEATGFVPADWRTSLVAYLASI